MSRDTRCPCGQRLVDGRCAPCDAIKASTRAAAKVRKARRAEAAKEGRIGLDRAEVNAAARRIVPQLAREAVEGRRRALRRPARPAGTQEGK